MIKRIRHHVVVETNPKVKSVLFPSPGSTKPWEVKVNHCGVFVVKNRIWEDVHLITVLAGDKIEEDQDE